MPNRPKRLCNHPGCPELVASGYCDKHAKQKQQQYDKQRGNFRQRGYTTAWDKVRAIKIKHNPLCERCEKKGIVTPAALVHHIVSLSKGGELSNINNLMSLCVQCHDEIHREQGDKW